MSAPATAIGDAADRNKGTRNSSRLLHHLNPTRNSQGRVGRHLDLHVDTVAPILDSGCSPPTAASNCFVSDPNLPLATCRRGLALISHREVPNRDHLHLDAASHSTPLLALPFVDQEVSPHVSLNSQLTNFAWADGQEHPGVAPLGRARPERQLRSQRT